MCCSWGCCYIHNDPCDITHPCGTIGAVFALKDTGGIHVCTQYGVLVGRKKEPIWFPTDCYKVIAKSTEDYTCPQLQEIHSKYNMELFYIQNFQKFL